MTPFYAEDGITLYCGDCRDVDLPDASVDLVLTDPPYGQQITHLRGVSAQTVNIRADGARQGMRVVRQALKHSEPSWSPDAHLLVFCHWESWPDFYDSIAPLAAIKNALIWWKNRGGMGDCEMEYARDYEVLLYGTRGRRKMLGKRPTAVIVGHPPVGTDRVHPTEKPVSLLRALIERHCPPDGLVFDPFVGSGSTLVAAKLSGRRAVGVEIEERYCVIARDRLRQGVLGL